MNDSFVLSGSETSARNVIFPKTFSGSLRLFNFTVAIFLLASNSWAAGKGAAKDVPAPPSNLIASAASSNQIVLQWRDNSTNESGFKIERAPTASGAWKQIATTGANAGSYVNTSLTPSTTYFYRVRAYNTRANSGYTGVASATTTAGAAVPCNYAISTSASPSAGGTTTGGGTVTCNSAVTVNATPSSGYNFVKWTENGVTVSTLPGYSFTATASRSLVATFAAIPCTYTINISSSPLAGGTTSGGGTVNCGSSVTVSAIANAGYTFANWTESGVLVSTSANYSFIAGGNRSLVANFTALPCTYTISTTTSGGGTSSGGGTVSCGSNVTVNAVPASCYRFLNWSEAGSVVSSSALYTFTASANRSLVANFALITYSINASVSPSGGGTVSGGGNINCGTLVTLSASPSSGYAFANWTENGVIASTSANYTFNATVDRTLVANFVAVSCTYAISTSTSPLAGGTTTGGGTVNCGATVTVAANPNTGYSFVNWMENGVIVSSSASYSFTASANRNLVANFAAAPCTYAITTSSSGGGTASGGGTVTCASSVTVTAVPASCFTFVSWTENGVVVSSSASYTFTANANRNLTANFALSTYTVSVGSSPSGGGTTSGGGTVNCGASVTINATPGSCYRFVNWTEGGTVVSSSASYTFVANANRTVVANFAIYNYFIVANVSASGGGTVSGAGTVNCAASVTLNATPASCYRFVNWTEGGTVVSSSASYTFVANANRMLVANFALNTYSIGASVSASGGGSVSGGGTVNCGATVTVAANPNTGYSFVNWMENGVIVSSSASYSFTASANRNLVANFAAAPCTYAITTSSSGGGTASGGGTVTCASSVTVTAVPASCFTFVSWTENGVVVSSSASYTFTANANRNLTANFALSSYTVSVGSSPSGGGTTSGGGTVNCGASVTINATPGSCYRFVNWTEGGTVVSSSASYTFLANANRTLVANFALSTYSIAATVSASGGGTVTGGGTINCGSSVTVSATPASCYSFLNWTENGVVVSSSASYSFTASVNRSLVANFSINRFTITTGSSPSAGGTTSGGGTVNCGSTVSGVATASTGYTFASWTENGIVVSTSASYLFTANASRNLVANFTSVPCTFTLSSSSASFNAGGGTSNVTVNASVGTCAWTASSSGWIHTSSGGTGNGTATYSIDANASSAPRSGSLTIAGQTFSINQAGHAAPVASAGPNRTVAVATPVSFTGSATSSDGATITSYSWSFGDLTTSSGVTVSHSYAAAGNFVATLTVSDSFGATSSATATVTVTNPITLSVNLSSPANGSTIANTINMSATASATATRVDFYCDNQTTPLGSATAVPFSFPCDTTLLSNGSHTFYAKAFDAAGNSATSAPVTATINNQTVAPSQWALRFGGIGNESGNAVAVDNNGNIFVAGYFMGATDFGGGILASAGGYDLVLAKYSPAGAHIWSRRFGGAGNELVTSIALDASGNIFLAGSLYLTANFGGADLTSAGDADAFVAKYSPQGEPIWSQRFGANFPDVIKSIATDSQGNVVVSGFFQGTVTIGGTTLYSWGTGIDPLMAKFSATGALVWAKNFYNAGTEYGNNVAVDKRINPLTGLPYDNIVMVGYFNGYINFGGGQVDANLLNTAGGYIAKFSPSGGLLWSKAYGGSNGSTRFWAMAVDFNGDIAVSGDFPLQTDLGGGPINGLSWGIDLFVAKFSGADGSYRWASPILGFQASVGRPVSMSADAQNNILMTGYFQGSYTFGTRSLASAPGTSDGWIAKYTSQGSSVWAQPFASTSSANGNSVCVDSTGHPIVTGYFNGSANCAGRSLTSAGGMDSLLMKLNP
jgi:hypothetical protein